MQKGIIKRFIGKIPSPQNHTYGYFWGRVNHSIPLGSSFIDMCSGEVELCIDIIFDFGAFANTEFYHYNLTLCFGI